MANVFFAYNGPKVTTAAPADVSTGTAIKTLLQIQPASKKITIVEWGISFDGTSGVPIKCELIDTQAINATVTAFASGDIVQLSGPSDDASLATLGTAASGYTSSAEGTITSTRLLDLQLVSP
ncbi:MAG: hypothetical protein KGL35_21230, partial [Bradyrhizobium sp.]|nr:hypothetical protein [Bradyrhizobium sp.]